MSSITFTKRGFVIRCRAKDLPTAIADLRKKYGDSPKEWVKNYVRAH